MATLKYLPQGAERASTVEFDSSPLGKKSKRSLLREAAIMYAARQRQGTHSTKNRSEVAGSGKKLWRQKHTGRARVGDRRMPHWRGGGIVHGPRPRDYSFAMPKKARLTALRHALVGKIEDGEIHIIDPLTLPVPKTATVVRALRSLGIEGSCLIISAVPDEILFKSARNIPGLTILPASDVSAMHLMQCRNVVMVKGALEAVCGRVSS